ncbi:hypothetical protein PGT21_007771 [Puccinia graminis f. sp. tritici]|uniref:Uncharacterized protein n=1 Tax=Puccinia graminis f. sp. tritici TaxID=56615 RepID=A0A5B0Q5D5_PUCGR|nr:hypothetical protein PGT21_007771 [Puccinia graminis f. sp. tritici]
MFRLQAEAGPSTQHSQSRAYQGLSSSVGAVGVKLLLPVPHSVQFGLSLRKQLDKRKKNQSREWKLNSVLVLLSTHLVILNAFPDIIIIHVSPGIYCG